MNDELSSVDRFKLIISDETTGEVSDTTFMYQHHVLVDGSHILISTEKFDITIVKDDTVSLEQLETMIGQSDTIIVNELPIMSLTLHKKGA